MENLEKEQKVVRRELEQIVISTNKYLKDVVKQMSNLILLRNTHPMMRSDYAYKMKDLKMIEPTEITEFIKTPTVTFRFR